MLQLPPIPTSILGLSDIEVERAEISHNGEFIITVKSTQKEVKCKKCNNPTEPHGHGRVIRLRLLPIFDHTTYIDLLRLEECVKAAMAILQRLNIAPGTIREALIQRLMNRRY